MLSTNRVQAIAVSLAVGSLASHVEFAHMVLVTAEAAHEADGRVLEKLSDAPALDDLEACARVHLPEAAEAVARFRKQLGLFVSAWMELQRAAPELSPATIQLICAAAQIQQIKGYVSAFAELRARGT